MSIDPVALSIFGLNIYWYGLFYVIGFIFAYFFITHYAKDFGLEKKKVEDIFFYTMIASVIGGRIFFVIFYQPLYFIQNPLEIIAVWNGGMSIHGGIFFGLLSLYYFSKKEKISLLKLTDLFVLPAGVGLGFGRLANFINQELVGKVTSSSLGVVFPAVDSQTRWPYQIFAGFKNIITFQIMYYLFIFKNLKEGMLTVLFLVLYSFGRFLVDILREPTIALGIISMGQLLSLIYGFAGVALYFKIRKD